MFSSLVLCKDRVNGVGGQGHGKRLETVNPTLCHLSDERIPTDFGMYKKCIFIGVVFIPELSTCGHPHRDVLSPA